MNMTASNTPPSGGQDDAAASTQNDAPQESSDKNDASKDLLSDSNSALSDESPPPNKDDDQSQQKDAPPEAYEFSAPDGMNVDENALKSYEDLAREQGLSQKQFSAITQHGLTYFQQKLGELAEQHNAREAGWRDAALKDHDLSDGTNLKADVTQNVGHVFDQFGGNDLRKALVETGAGNHPVIIKAFNSIGKALGVAQPPDHGKPAHEINDKSWEAMANRRYGHHN